VGHVFYLGTKYSAAMNATVLDEEGNQRPMEMGCYGIGITRMLAAIIEQNHDDNGIIWPMAVAPYHVIVQLLQVQDEEVVKVADEIYAGLKAHGVEVLLDDRDLRPGNKFKDADLIGIPIRVTVGGRGVKEGIVEVKGRREESAQNIPITDVVAHVHAQVQVALSR
jgi:prolyl-tRNA synthetase